jgi:hypothetical protein
VGLFVYAVYAGSVRYHKMTTKWYAKAVEELLRENQAETMKSELLVRTKSQ